MSQSDFDLIQACRQDEPNAWQLLLDKYGRMVYSISLNYGLTAEDAADITQITFTILLQSLDAFDENVRLGGWLATVARRHTWRLLERRRRESTQPGHDLAASLNLAASDAGPRSLRRWELVEWLESGLRLLDPRCQELLLALYFDHEQPSYADVAARMEMPVGSVGPTRARCLEQLRRLLQEEGDY